MITLEVVMIIGESRKWISRGQGCFRSLPMPCDKTISAHRAATFQLELTSKHAIIMPQAGAIFAIRGMVPAKRAEAPSVRIMPSRKGIEEVTWPEEGAIIRAWRRVLRTSKGEVMRAAEVPLTAPQIKATHAPSRPRRLNSLFQAS